MTDNPIRCSGDMVTVPMNGAVEYSTTSPDNSYAYGTVAAFSCNTGFGLSSVETRTCTGEEGNVTGYFNGSSPSCERKSSV